MKKKIKGIEIEETQIDEKEIEALKEEIKKEHKIRVRLKIGFLGAYVVELEENKKEKKGDPDYKIERLNGGISLFIFENKKKDVYNCVLNLGFLGTYKIDCKNVYFDKNHIVKEIETFPDVHYYGEDKTGTLGIYIKVI